ncbi:hypothetical protein ACHAPT_000131 [Fusarium lateritium]
MAPKRTRTRPCAIYYPDISVVLGGAKIGFPDSLHTEFVVHNPTYGQAHIGLNIHFPRIDENIAAASFYRARDGQPSPNYVVSIRFFPGTFDIQGHELSDSDYLTLLGSGSSAQDNKMAVVHVTLKPHEAPPAVDGIGLPFEGPTRMINDYINADTKIQGFRSLHEILSQNEFYLLFPDRHVLPRANAGFKEDLPSHYNPTYAYGPSDWNLRFFREVIPANLSSSQYPVKYQFDGRTEAHTSLIHSVVQEVFWVIQDCNKIRLGTMPVRFIKLDKNKSTKENTHFLLVATLDDEFMAEYANTLPRVTKEGTPVKLFFGLPPDPKTKKEDDECWDGFMVPVDLPEHPHDGNLESVYLKFNSNSGIAKRRVAAISKVFEPILPELPGKKEQLDKDEDDGEDDDEDEDGEDVDDDSGTANPNSSGDDTMSMVEQLIRDKDVEGLEITQKDIDDLVRMNLFLQDFVIGRGFPSVLRCDDVDDLANQLAQTSLTTPGAGCSRLSPPKVDFFHETDLHLVTTILSKLRPDTRRRFIKYLDLIPLGLIGIFGFAGSGKTETLAIVAHLFLSKYSHIYASAPTHVATTNFATRFYRVGKSVIETYNATAPPGTPQRTLPLVVRGYDVRTEILAFFKVIHENSTDITPGGSTTRWDIKLSLCEWLLKIVKFGEWDLDALDDPILFALRQAFETDEQYAIVRRFAQGGMTYSDLMDMEKTAEADSSETAAPPDSPETASNPGSAVPKPEPTNIMTAVWGRTKSQVDLFYKCILQYAQAICTTPHASTSNPYKRYKLMADAVVLDEAGAMWKADALQVIGQYLRPVAMAGDENQLPPTVMTLMDKKDGNMLNRFAPDARTSILEHFKRSGQACFVLNEQLRVARGQFDLAQALIYPDVKGFAYGPNTALENQPVAMMVERWVQKTYGVRSPADKSLPVFFHCEYSVCESHERSRVNEDQNGIAIDLVRKLIIDCSLPGKDFVIISPYRANLQRLQQALKEQSSSLPDLADITVNTADSFQGREGQVVVLVLCVTKETGALFVANRNRICVGITRQVGALFVVGDIDTISPDTHAKETSQTQEGDDGEVELVKTNIFRDFLRYFRDNHRVVLTQGGRTDNGNDSARVDGGSWGNQVSPEDKEWDWKPQASEKAAAAEGDIVW